MAKDRVAALFAPFYLLTPPTLAISQDVPGSRIILQWHFFSSGFIVPSPPHTYLIPLQPTILEKCQVTSVPCFVTVKAASQVYALIPRTTL